MNKTILWQEKKSKNKEKKGRTTEKSSRKKTDSEKMFKLKRDKTKILRGKRIKIWMYLCELNFVCVCVFYFGLLWENKGRRRRLLVYSTLCVIFIGLVLIFFILFSHIVMFFIFFFHLLWAVNRIKPKKKILFLSQLKCGNIWRNENSACVRVCMPKTKNVYYIMCIPICSVYCV